MNEIQKFRYNDVIIDFDLQNNKLMVNATQMAKIFDQKVERFTRLEGTQIFIQECLKSYNCSFLGIEKEEDLISSVQKSGTFMHRILALKFAAWLDPAFELWVYTTIDQVLFGKYRDIEDSLKESARRRHRIETLKEELRTSNQFQQLEMLLLEEKQAAYRRNQSNKAQLSLFQELLPENID